VAEEHGSSKYAECIVDWLGEVGYTHCFFVAGGNIMHLLDAARTRMRCIPFVHEVAAGIATEYFNESGGEGRAFALVTAGPGLTNIVSAMAGAYLESRELLVVGGQVKSTDLAGPALRQRGIQEIDGVSLAEPVTVSSLRIEEPIAREQFLEVIRRGTNGRAGPVFVEVCLDVQGAPVGSERQTGTLATARNGPDTLAVSAAEGAISAIDALMREAERPVWLIGGGVTRATADEVRDALAASAVPVMTTWNGADRIGADEEYYFGRPNTWGQRYANVLLQQADLIVAFGTRLGIQQTGFNWQGFAPKARVVQFDIDARELEKGHPAVDVAVAGDANTALVALAARHYRGYDDWVSFCRTVKNLLPLSEASNVTGPGYVSPYDFYLALSRLATQDDVVIPCSSGGANAVAMQAFLQKRGQVVITDKGLASMGYGLSGAIGAAIAHPERRVLMVEGDGGFCQNLQELATVAVNHLNLKIFVMSNEGYASIRMTQRNHMGGHYLGCDTRTGLGFPDWRQLFGAFGIPVMELEPGWDNSSAVRSALDEPGPYGFVLLVDPEQTYYPKITSRVTMTGGMESQPLHLMSPDLAPEIAQQVFKFI
jgi:acetolactate synthase I/II/III large subunit